MEIYISIRKCAKRRKAILYVVFKQIRLSLRAIFIFISFLQLNTLF